MVCGPPIFVLRLLSHAEIQFANLIPELSCGPAFLKKQGADASPLVPGQ